MNALFALATAATARLAEMQPDLDLSIKVELTPLQARVLADTMDEILLPALIEGAIEAAEAGDTEKKNAICDRGIVLADVRAALRTGMDTTADRIRRAREHEEAKREDAELAELRRNLEPAE